VTYFGRLRLHNDLLQVFALIFDLISWEAINVEVVAEGGCDSFETEQIVAICGHLNLVNSLFGDVNGVSVSIDAIHLHFLTSSVFQLEPNLEAKILKFFKGDFVTDSLEQFFFQNVNVWHVFSIFLLSLFVDKGVLFDNFCALISQ